MMLLAVFFLAAWLPPLAAAPADKAEIVEVKALWSRAPHNAFTDLARFKNRWYCVFREGKTQLSTDGKVRVLTSVDGEVWTPAALLSWDFWDLRDPKLSVTPDQRLMLNAGAAAWDADGVRYQSLVWFSGDGREWTKPLPVAEPGMWLWRVAWSHGRAYGAAYREHPGRALRFYTSANGADFQVLAENPYPGDGPAEASLIILADRTALCLLGREGRNPTAQLGRAAPPYRGWNWTDLGTRVGGPNVLQLPDERLVAAIRLYEPNPRTSLCWLDTAEGKLTEFLVLPSGGDTGCPGMVFHGGLLWVSYYSSHEGKAMVYIAKVRLPRAQEEQPFELKRYKGR